MKKGSIIKISLMLTLILSIICLGLTSFAYDEPDKGYKADVGEMRKLADGVYAYLQSGGAYNSNNGIIIGKDYVILVDSQTNKYQAENLIKAIKKVTDKPVRLLFNTHYHPDHTWTNYLFPEAITFCTVACRQKTLELGPNEQEIFQKTMASDRLNFEGAVKTPQAMTFDGKLTIYDGIREIQFLELGSGHSHTDAVVYLPKERIVFGGDVVGGIGGEAYEKVQAIVPRIYSGSSNIADVYWKLAGIDADVFVPGHGNDTFTREQVAIQAAGVIEGMLFVREEARKLFNKGMTYQEAFKNLDYDKFEKFGYGDKDSVSGGMLGTLARLWLEFRGYPTGTPVNIEEIFGLELGRPDYVLPPPSMKTTGQKSVSINEIN